jgi:hypothetical protein
MVAPRFVVVLAGLGILISASFVHAQTYRRTLTVANPTSAFQGNTPVDVPIDPAMLGNMFVPDFWFKSIDGVTLLPRWVESWSSPDLTKVWVRVPSIPPNSSVTLYLEYGGPPQGISSFEQTFVSSYLVTTGQAVVLSGTLPYYDSFEIQPGATVIAQAGSPLAIRAGRVRIAGTIDAAGQGEQGQIAPWTNGNGAGGGTASFYGGGGGAGYGGTGGAGGSPVGITAVGGPVYGTLHGADTNLGSSGGSGEVGSGAGGGSVRLMGQRIDMYGTIDARGGMGGFSSFSFGGGGGSGGSIRLEAQRVYSGGAILRADGGPGGEPGGGGGGGGRIKVHVGDWYKSDLFNPSLFSVQGGPGAVSNIPTMPQPGSPGQSFTGQYLSAGLASPWLSISVGPEQVVGVEPNNPSVALVGLPTPNPSRHDLSLRLELVRPGRCRVAILDLPGRRVRQLADEMAPAGARTISWDLRDDDRRRVPSGLYFVCVDVDGSQWTRKVLVAR